MIMPRGHILSFGPLWLASVLNYDEVRSESTLTSYHDLALALSFCSLWEEHVDIAHHLTLGYFGWGEYAM